MHFAICLPDWNSLDSVRHAHNELEGAALLFFALLVFFDLLAHLSSADKKREKFFEKIGLYCFALAVLAEIVAYPYGQRNDTLSEQIIGSLDAKASAASTNASDALTKAETANAVAGIAQKKAELAETSADRTGQLAILAEADARSAQQDAARVRIELKKAIADVEASESRQREINEVLEIEAEYGSEHPNGPSLRVLKNDLLDLLKTLPPATAIVEYKQGDSEALAFARVIIHVLKSAGWGVSEDSAAPRPIHFGSEDFKYLTESGVRIFNKDTSSGISGVREVQPNGIVVEELEFQIRALVSQGMTRINATRLTDLAMGLGARLTKDETLTGDSFRILVSGRELMKDK
jgi:hypothetical protein